MFIGYNLTITDDEKVEFLKYEQRGKQHLKCQKAALIKTIEEYVIDGIVDGTQVERDWFPMIDVDIFISHSHVDEKLANGIAGWMSEHFGLRCFVDSCVWNYSDDLLKSINARYSNKRLDINGEYIYDYKKCNVASQHVYMMLSIALQKMIDKTEAIILLNTPNSISNYGSVYNEITYSPWIYSEIICTQIVRRKSLLEYRIGSNILQHMYESFLENESENLFKTVYEVSLDHLETLNVKLLLQWKKKNDIVNTKYPLDCLYEITNPEEMKVIKKFREKNDVLYGLKI